MSRCSTPNPWALVGECLSVVVDARRLSGLPSGLPPPLGNSHLLHSSPPCHNLLLLSRSFLSSGSATLSSEVSTPPAGSPTGLSSQ